MSNLEKHAEREMRLAGLYEADSNYGGMIPDAVMKLVRAHASEGHSGGSHELTFEIFKRVVNFKPLTPLTPDPSEWNDVSESSGKPMWQSNRSPSVFSEDGGETWRDINVKDPTPIPGRSR